MSEPWPELDRLAHSTAAILGVPMLLISTVEDQRLLVRAADGVSDSLLARIREGQVVCPLCQQVTAGGQPVLVQDARRRVQALGHGALGSLGIAAYAGVPIRTSDGSCVGALAAIDHIPRAWQSRDMMILGAFAEAVSALVGQRQQARRLAQLEALERAMERPLHDELTGLLNRRGFLAAGDHHLARARRNQLTGLLFYADVDCSNDAGATAGDVLLQGAADVFRRTFRDADTIARLGGGTFAALSVDAEEQDGSAMAARLLAERGRVDLQRDTLSPPMWRVGMSVFGPTSTQTLHALLREAAARMNGQDPGGMDG